MTTDLLPAREVACAHCHGTGKITLPEEIESIDVLFFGCWRDLGHYWIDPGNVATHGMRAAEDKLPEELRHGRIDGGFCPGSPESLEDRRRDRKTRPEVEGEARLTHLAGWTVLGWWDRSVDKRGACNSNIVARGIHDYTTMLEIGKRRMPHVMARQRQELKLVQTSSRPATDAKASDAKVAP